MKRALLGRLLAACSEKRPLVLVTDLASGDAWLLDAEGGGAPDPTEGGGAPDPRLVAPARAALARDACESLELDGRSYFLQPFARPLRLVIVGAVHIAQPLAAMAGLAGYEVVIVDPREAFASAERFPGVALRSEWPDQALAALALDARSAVVTLTHDPKLDDAALFVALRSPAFYVGSLGSQKTHAARLTRLRELGFTDAELARIHAPVGLDIGARSPGEIAVAVLAQITEQLRGPRR